MAFARLMEMHAARLLAYLRYRSSGAVGADCDVDDLFQMACLTAWTRLDRYKDSGPGSFYRWLIAHARGAVSDRRKYLHGKGRGSVQSAGEWLARAPVATPSIGATVSSCLAWKEDGERLARYIAELSEPARTIIRLHDIEGWTLSAIGVRLNLPKTTTFEERQRGLEFIRRRMQAST